jgi:hypothetical protein
VSRAWETQVSKRDCTREIKNSAHQDPPPPPPPPEDEPKEPAAVVGPDVAPALLTVAQTLVYQLRILVMPSVGQAPSQTPLTPELKGCSRLSAHRQASYTETSLVGCAGGTQAPLTSYNFPHAVIHGGRPALANNVV